MLIDAALRPILALRTEEKFPVVMGPPPQLIMLRPDQLFVNDDYQRSLSGSSEDHILRMARRWDWMAYQAPNVAATEHPDIYEVLDGQHTVTAAVTNGSIPLLPCLLSSASSLSEKAGSFIKINTQRKTLTPVDVFNARVAAQDDAAIGVTCALSAANCELLAVPPSDRRWKPGHTMAVGTLLAIMRSRGEARLTTLLVIAKAAGAAPTSANLLKALDIAVPLALPSSIEQRIIDMLRGAGPGRIEMKAFALSKENRRRTCDIMADVIAEKASLPRRMGKAK